MGKIRWIRTEYRWIRMGIKEKEVIKNAGNRIKLLFFSNLSVKSKPSIMKKVKYQNLYQQKNNRRKTILVQKH